MLNRDSTYCVSIGSQLKLKFQFPIFVFLFVTGRRCSDDFKPPERRNQDLGLDGRQAGDGHQHRLLLPTPVRRARRRTLHCRRKHF